MWIWTEFSTFVLSLVAFLGPFTILDAVTERKSRETIADYVFGFHGFTIRDLEEQIIKSWVGLFFDGRRIRIFRVMIASLAFALGPILAFELLMNWSNGIEPRAGALQAVASFGLALAIGTFPFDIVNLSVSRWVYFGPPSAGRLWWKLSLDIVLSTICCLILLLVLTGLVGVLKDVEFITRFWIGKEGIYPNFFFEIIVMFGTTYSLAQYILLRVAAIAVSVFARGVISLTNLNSYAAVHTGFYSLPITFSAALLFTIGYLGALLAGFLLP